MRDCSPKSLVYRYKSVEIFLEWFAIKPNVLIDLIPKFYFIFSDVVLLLKKYKDMISKFHSMFIISVAKVSSHIDQSIVKLPY